MTARLRADLFDRLPPVGERRVAVRVTPAALREIRRGHPWLYDGGVRSLNHEGAVGDLAVIFDDDRRFVAIGLFDPTSPIRVRVLHRGAPRTIDADFWRTQVAASLERRSALDADPTTTGYRLVHGESDGFPGLVVDRYDATLVVKLYTAAWAPHLSDVLTALLDATGAARIVVRLARNTTVPPLTDGIVVTESDDGADADGDAVWYLEHGLDLLAHPRTGQKTGAFHDQRDNRRRVAEHAGGRAVLDVFCCTGGFSAAAVAGEASAVTSVDIAPGAIATTGQVVDAAGRRRGGSAAVTDGIVGDAFRVMADLRPTGRRFGLIVVDPPSFASRAGEERRALAAYSKLTRLAVDLLAPGGMLVQASCSSRVGAEEFAGAVLSAARDAAGPRGRVREVLRTGHAADHPIGFPEAAYLKALYCEIDHGPARR